MKSIRKTVFVGMMLMCVIAACSNKETALQQEILNLQEQISRLETERDALKSQIKSVSLSTSDIKHTVIFNLKHTPDSPETKKFLQDGKAILSAIEAVNNFEVFKQVSNKNEFQYCFSMHFSDQTAYETYNKHPSHVDFVKNRWEKEVSKFLEIDLMPF